MRAQYFIAFLLCLFTVGSFCKRGERSSKGGGQNDNPVHFSTARAKKSVVVDEDEISCECTCGSARKGMGTSNEPEKKKKEKSGGRRNQRPEDVPTISKK